MKWIDYYKSLSQDERAAYAERASTTKPYVDNHLVRCRKIPKRRLMENLSKASDGNVTYAEVLNHFYDFMNGGEDDKRD